MFIFFIFFAVIGLILNLNYGLFVGLLVGVLVFCFISKWGEKIILVFSRARYVTDDENLINQIKNFSAHLGIKHVAIYWSNTFENNVYFTDSYFGTPALIIGRNVYLGFSKNELNSLIYASLLKIKSKEAQSRTMVSLLFLVIFSPFYLMYSLVKIKKIKEFLIVFVYPALALKNLMYEKEKDVISFDLIVGSMRGLKKDYISAIFKLSFLESQNEKLIGYLALSDLVHAKNQTIDAVESVLLSPVDINKRLKALSAI